jgi:hypothetical protein
VINDEIWRFMDVKRGDKSATGIGAKLGYCPLIKTGNLNNSVNSVASNLAVGILPGSLIGR